MAEIIPFPRRFHVIFDPLDPGCPKHCRIPPRTALAAETFVFNGYRIPAWWCDFAATEGAWSLFEPAGIFWREG